MLTTIPFFPLPQKHMATNICYNYLYRDSGNYKKFGHRDYSNSDNLSFEEAERQSREQNLCKERIGDLVERFDPLKMFSVPVCMPLTNQSLPFI
jgi:hypothetical protein